MPIIISERKISRSKAKKLRLCWTRIRNGAVRQSTQCTCRNASQKETKIIPKPDLHIPASAPRVPELAVRNANANFLSLQATIEAKDDDIGAKEIALQNREAEIVLLRSEMSLRDAQLSAFVPQMQRQLDQFHKHMSSAMQQLLLRIALSPRTSKSCGSITNR